jgi:hypothetical protein
MTLRQTILAATAICALPLAAQAGDYVTYESAAWPSKAMSRRPRARAGALS